MEKTAVIMCGGKGTRLYPYTVSLPKPLLPVGDKPILEIILEQLRSHGFRKVILAVNHQADIIKSYFGEGEKYGIDLSYSLEREPLSTMGPLTLLHDLPEYFLVMNGDVLTDLDFGRFFESHIEEGADLTISAYKAQQESRFGVLELDLSNQWVTAFQEKPVTGLVVSMGVYALSRSILSIIPTGQPFGFDNLMYLGLKQSLAIRAIVYEGYWRDLGTPEDYQKANDEVSEQRLT